MDNWIDQTRTILLLDHLQRLIKEVYPNEAIRAESWDELCEIRGAQKAVITLRDFIMREAAKEKR